MQGFATPEKAAMHGMPPGITHVVKVAINDDGHDGQEAYVLLAVEVEGGSRFYLDENVCERNADGSWSGSYGGGGEWVDQSLEELRENPPPRSL